MIQGVGSNVGKSLIVAGLCRLFARRGLKVRPFKPQNMSNNAAVADDGGEIGRAQALQARAAMVRPSVDMNPVLLKPESDRGAQLIVQGQRRATLSARDYGAYKAQLMEPVLESFARLGREADLVVVEGAGSPAETNLRAHDIANMGFASAAGVAVVLVGDIERGGVIAHLVGTHAVLDAADRALVRGFIVNKFRGDAALFADGAAEIERLTAWPFLGLVPMFEDARQLPAEDSVDLADRLRADAPTESAAGAKRIKIAVPRLPRTANFDDLDPLRLETGIDIVLVEPGAPIPADADLVLLTGSKSTIADLETLKREGWDIDIHAHWRRGGRVIGICGGFQMLGRNIADPGGIEGARGEVAGLGLIDIKTELQPHKQTREVNAMHLASGHQIEGYEIHLGVISGPDCARPLLQIDGRSEGAISAEGRVLGTHVHGLFASDAFRRWFITELGSAEKTGLTYETAIESALNGLADHLETHLDCDRLLRIARQNNIASSA
ncbi:MAG: cobyric acid synthase [Rhizobiales bacterium]|nr:cobyric acid synthase [Hyphomicrobiales bacterium]